jgi:transcription elongation GreA/GreB family factor
MTCDHIRSDVHRAPHATGVVGVGSQVRVLAPWGEDEYVIVSPRSADPQQGHISSLSPVGAALLGRRLSDEVWVETPSGVQRLTVLAVACPVESRA